MLDKIKYKIMYGTAVPAIIMISIAAVTLVVFYLMTKDDRQVKSLEVGEVLQLDTNLDTSIEGIEWTTSDVNVATVSASGLVTALTPGDINIKLTVDGEPIQKYRVIVYTYNDDNKYIPVKKLDLTPSKNDMYIGDKTNLAAKITPDDATNRELKWESSDQNIATVNQAGQVTAISEGTATITAKSINNIEASSIVTVSKKATSTPPPKPSVNVNVSSLTINQGGIGAFRIGVTKQLTVTVAPENATNKTITWSSSNTKVATVDNNGKFTTVGEGVTTIVATSNNGMKTGYVVTVNKHVTPELSVNVSANSTTVGSSIQIYAENNTGSAIKYASSNDKIATVDKNGKVTTKRTGNVTITIKSDNISKDVNINITGYRVHFIDIDVSGDAILLESNGRYAMIDSGLEDSQVKVKKYLDNLGIKNLDFMIITHPHIDHNGGVLYLLNNGIKIDTIYQKQYTSKDSAAYYGSKSIGNRVNNIISTATKYGTKIIYVDKLFYEGQYIMFDNMKIYFYNVIQRMVNVKNDGDIFNYDTSQFWANRTENPNSIANLIVVNNHTLLTTADINDYNILSGVISRVSSIVSNLDVYRLSHHGYYNCTGEKDMNIYAKYYVATNSIDVKLSDGNYALTNDVINNNGNILKSCFAHMNLNMCDVYYSCDSTNSIIANFSTANVTLSGGGLGRNSSSRCR